MLRIQNDTIVKILWKQRQGNMTTTEEDKILEEWCSASEHNRAMLAEISDEEQWKNDLKRALDRDENAVWNKILPFIQEGNQVAQVVKIRKPWYNYAAAAALIAFALGTGVYFIMNNGVKKETTTTTVAEEKSVGREDERAFLTLSDGSTIYLDEAKNGELALQGNSKINKLKDGELVYDAANKNIATNQLPLTFNILSTPRGTQYKLVLNDGSKIWLNAASSLRFPSSFSEGERVVELTGEAYFEVPPSKLDGRNSRAPFYVKANGVKVEVLGTHFNVMAYKDEPVVKTSLIEGKVKVSSGGHSAMLKPGQQAQAENPEMLPVHSNSPISITNGGANDAITWKDGYLDFKSVNIAYVLRQISRSFKLDVVVKGTSTAEFSGKINIKTNISEILDALKLNGVNAKIVNGKINVDLNTDLP